METKQTTTINIGILAHVDAGKTTLTEQILYATGAIRNAGSVDKGSAHTDTMDVERRRGISVRAASAQIEWRGVEINVIDTPGHTDFSSEIEFSLLPLECAVMVVSAVEGVQPQTRAIFKALKKMGIPTLFFINKTDRTGADTHMVKDEIETEFTINLANFTNNDELINTLCENDDDFMSYCLHLDCDASKIDRTAIIPVLKKQFCAQQVYAYITGSAVNSVGVSQLLDAIIEICPRFGENNAGIDNGINDGDVAAVVFKVEHTKPLGRSVHIKLISGTIKNRDVLFNSTSKVNEKIAQIKVNRGVKAIDSGTLAAGGIGIVSGLTATRTGDILLSSENTAPPAFLRRFNVSGSIAVPLLRSKITPLDENDYPALVAAIDELSAEDPNLNMVWEKEERELIINIAGPVQLEILREIMADRFNLNVTFGAPSVIYKETPSKVAEGFDAYTMPKPCWAILKFLIEPGANGSGIVYKSIVNTSRLFPAYQSQVEQALPVALRQGPLGWEVTDAKITLIDGEHHLVHTHPLDFIVATPMAMMNGLINAGTSLLEPLYNFTLTVPDDMGGRVMNEINAMRGQMDTPVISKGTFKIKGFYPVSTGMDFPVKAASLTKGQSVLSLEFGGYQKCDLSLGQTTHYRGISPNDRPKYILHARGSL